ncbi:MAG: anthranilate phosphoribosyltransferase [bacterium]|jgi:anthranilate phosphoribosyltransferase
MENTITSTKLLDQLLDGKNLTSESAKWMMTQCMEGLISPVQMSAILVALRMKGETVEEVTACVQVMREKSTKISFSAETIVDTCGTGGDSSGTFNVSTTVALLLAAGGYKIAKHGNRSMTSKSGSADLLEALGLNIGLTPEQVATCIEETNFGFLFAPALHSAMKNVVPVRKELAVRTIFNILGPLTNPAGANVQIIGLFTPTLVSKVIHVLKELGTRSAFVVSGETGMDEVSITCKTHVAHLSANGEIKEFLFDPTQFGFELAELSDIQGGSPEYNAEITRSILSGECQDAKRDMIVLNTGFAIAAADNLELSEAFEKARQLLDSKNGIELIEKVASLSKSF